MINIYNVKIKQIKLIVTFPATRNNFIMSSIKMKNISVILTIGDYSHFLKLSFSYVKCFATYNNIFKA